MGRLPLAYGGVEYLDRTLALQTGVVSPGGVDLSYVVVPGIGDLFRRMVQHAEFDAAEMSACTYIMMSGRDDRRLVAIPVFPSRSFRHGQIYVHGDAPIARPEDLVDRDVGVLDYQMTAALWIRAFLEHDYGVSPTKIRWWTGGLYTPAYAERMAMSAPPGVQLQRIPEDETLEGMLAAGKLDALVTVEPPRLFRARSSSIRRLFPDHRSVEREYFRRTGFFPIMHLVVVRRDVYERNRWLAVSLVEAFEAAKRIGTERMRYQGALAVGVPWLGSDMEEIDELFGGDAFPYGVARNRRILERMTEYAHEQGLTPRRVGVDELFAPETYQDPVPG